MKKHVIFLILVALSFFTIMPAAAQENSEPTSFWWNDRVFYEIFVRSFYDSDGDGIGDLRGVIERLDYLNDGDPDTTTDLGITGIWLMPVMQSPSYHGYDVTDYYQIDEDYGTLEDFRELISAAHERGIAVIVDLVMNHTSSQHPWFTDSAAGDPDTAEWYIWATQDPSYVGPWGQPVWHQRGDRYYYGVFWDGMPDLNYRNRAVTEAMYDINRFWLEEVGVDGFRLDAIKHLIEDGQVQENTPESHAWMSAYDDFIDSINPDALTIGEVWSSSYDSSDYVNADEVDMTFEFDLATGMVESARQGSNAAITSMQERVVELYPSNQYATFLTNHDQNRIMSVLRGNNDAARIAAALLLTAPGVPFLYYGEEIGMEGMKPDERIRTPMQWDATPVTAGFTTDDQPWQPLSTGNEDGVSVAAQIADPDSLLSTYRSLIHLRNNHPALQSGDYLPIDCGDRDLYAFLRQHDDETVMVLLNLDEESITDYACTLESSALSGEVATLLLFGAGDIAAPTLNESGGFTDFQPLPQVEPFSITIIQLSAAS
jgi:glycosidase